MTSGELQLLINDDKLELTIKEVKNIIYKLMQDTINEELNCAKASDYLKARYYTGENNAFYISLKILDKVKE